MRNAGLEETQARIKIAGEKFQSAAQFGPVVAAKRSGIS